MYMLSVVVTQAFIPYYANAKRLVYYKKKRSMKIAQQKKVLGQEEN
jgi:hypothetical protein